MDLAKPKSGAKELEFCNFTVRFSVYIVWPSLLILNNLKLHKIYGVKKNNLYKKNLYFSCLFKILGCCQPASDKASPDYNKLTLLEPVIQSKSSS